MSDSTLIGRKKWSYQRISVKGFVFRNELTTLLAGSQSSWKASASTTQRERASTKSMVETTRAQSVQVSDSVESSVKAGVSFPIDVVSVTGEASMDAKHSFTKSFNDSRTIRGDYEKETEKSLEEGVELTLAAFSDKDMPDVVVYEEIVMYGKLELSRKYTSARKPDFEALPKQEDFDVTIDVAVDYQWYTIRNSKCTGGFPAGAYLSKYRMTDSGLGVGKNWVVAARPTHSAYQHWRWEGSRLVNRVEGEFLQASGETVFLNPNKTDHSNQQWNYKGRWQNIESVDEGKALSFTMNGGFVGDDYDTSPKLMTNYDAKQSLWAFDPVM